MTITHKHRLPGDVLRALVAREIERGNFINILIEDDRGGNGDFVITITREKAAA
jgi:hypothetical protein